MNKFILVTFLLFVKEIKILVTNRGNMQSDVLKATLAADAIIGSMVRPFCLYLIA